MNSINNNKYDYVQSNFYDYMSVSSQIVSTYRHPEWKSSKIKFQQKEIAFPLIVDLINTNIVVRF